MEGVSEDGEDFEDALFRMSQEQEEEALIAALGLSSISLSSIANGITTHEIAVANMKGLRMKTDDGEWIWWKVMSLWTPMRGGGRSVDFSVS